MRLHLAPLSLWVRSPVLFVLLFCLFASSLLRHPLHPRAIHPLAPFRAASFCFFTLLGRLDWANLSTLFSSESRAFFFAFFSLLRRARFCVGVSSLRAWRSCAEGGAKTSSGASMEDVDMVVGNADSKDAAATFVTVEIEPLGCCTKWKWKA